MPENLSYWYSPTSSSHVSSELPPQAIPTTRKTDRWKRATMDALERIGMVQLRENMVYGDFYRMVEGKMAFTELADAIPQLRDVAQALDDLEIPAFIKHYDLIGIIVNALVGEYMQNRDKFMVTNTDEFATSEYERTKLNYLHLYLKEELDKEIQVRMIQMGMNPDPDAIDIEDPEQREAAIQEIQAMKQQMTPPEIENFMNKSWKTDAAKWGELTLEADYERFYMHELERNELIDFLLTGRCFRHHRIGYDNYKPETWSPKNTFISKTLDTKYPQDGEYAGRIHYYAPSEVVNKYGSKLTKGDKDKLLVGAEIYDAGFGDINDPISYKQMFDKNFGETKIVPHKQFYDYNFMVELEDELGVPLAEKTILNKDGSKTTLPTYLPRSRDLQLGANYYAQSIRDDLRLRRDLIRTTEAYWISYQKIAYFTYVTPEGRITQEIVTDEILRDFLKDEEIKSLRETTLEEIEKNPQPNTIVWDYIPQVWRGVKLNRDGARVEDSVYLDIEPLDIEITGDSNLYDLKLPVSGIVDQSLALKMQPYQMSYNVVMNQLYNLLEKEIGMFFVFDINYLPSEFKDWGNTEETLVYLRDFAKDVGLFGLDTTKQNLQSAGGFNQFAPQDLSLTGQMSQRVQLSEFYKNKAFEQIGFNPQRLGTPVKYETAEGVRQSQTASYAQTEVYFEKFADYKKRCLEMHLNVAQHCQKNNKDISVHFTKSDGTKAYLKFTDDNFQLRKLGILPISNSKKRKELETFKNFIMQNNTMGSDELSLAQLFTSDTMTELIESARVSRQAREQQQALAHQRQMEANEQQAALEEQKEQAKWEREEISKDKDRAVKLEEERINALGRAADKDATIESFNQINREADIAIKRQKSEDDTQIKLKELESKEEDMREKRRMQAEEFNLRVKELEEKKKERESREYIARINKN
jgi:hypothetical protein